MSVTHQVVPATSTSSAGSAAIPDTDWWRGAVIYQIYPRSFADSNGDGIGDLRGITSKLDYVASLGVDAIWLSPFFKSPMKDFGYDISDYRDVDPIFGTLADFDALVARAHTLGLKVLIDQVLSHSSDQHAWFHESRSSRVNPKADWYVWADPKPDGTPPNNWLSVFGGSAWQWDTRRCQYYLHNFLVSQPDLNFYNPHVQTQLLEELEFWLKRGVDGIRFDAVNFYFHDAQLRDNPPRAAGDKADQTTPLSNPYAWQRHEFDKSRPENLDFLRRLRALMNRYGALTSVGEIGDDDPLATMAAYTGAGDKLHMGYTFNLIRDVIDAGDIREAAQTVAEGIGDGWACWALGNHDAPRVASRSRDGNATAELATVLTALLTSLRGSSCIYQGEELGLTDVDVAFNDLQDPYGITFWPQFKGRDGCRTPMPWVQRAPHAGFSTIRPWLPVGAEHFGLAVDVQEPLIRSALNRIRIFLGWRRQVTTLKAGDIEFLDSPTGTLCFVRTDSDGAIIAAFNLSAQTAEIPATGIGVITTLSGHGFSGELNEGCIVLAPCDAYFGRVEGR